MIFSFACAGILSASGARFSYVHTDTRLCVTLCVADCTRQGPTWNVGISCGAGSEPGVGEDGPPAADELALALGPGVEARLPDDPKPGREVDEGAPML